MLNSKYKEKLMEQQLFTNSTINILKKELGHHLFNIYQFWCDRIFKCKENTYSILTGDLSTISFAMFYKLINEKLKKSIDDKFSISYDESGALVIKNNTSGVKNVILNENMLKSNFQFDPNYKFSIIKDVTANGLDLENARKTLKIKLNHIKPLIDTICYHFSTDAVIYKPDIAYSFSNGIGHYTLTNSINHCINYLNMPHSFLNNVTHKENVDIDKFLDILESLNNNESLYVHKLDSDMHAGLISYMLVEKQTNLLGNERLKCCKIQYNPNTKLLSLEPIVLLKSSDLKEILSCTSIYLKTIPEVIKKDLSVSSSLPYDLLITIASYSYGKYFADKYMPEFKGTDDLFELLTLTYGNQVRDEILNLANYRDIQNAYDNATSANYSKSLMKSTDIMQHIHELWSKNAENACYLLDKNLEVQLKCVKNYNNLAELLEMMINAEANITTTISEDKYSQLLDINELSLHAVISDNQNTSHTDKQLRSENSSYYGKIIE